MKIGEIARQTGVSKSLIRYYERKDVLAHAIRDSSGYREYGISDLARIQLVTGARRLGCSFAEIQDILAMQDEQCIPTTHLLELLQQVMAEVGSEINRLQTVQKELSRLHQYGLKLASVVT